MALLDQGPPAGYGRWTAPLLSRELGDVSDQYIWRFLREPKWMYLRRVLPTATPVRRVSCGLGLIA